LNIKNHFFLKIYQVFFLKKNFFFFTNFLPSLFVILKNIDVLKMPQMPQTKKFGAGHFHPGGGHFAMTTILSSTFPPC
jgi:hypothetical protein